MEQIITALLSLAKHWLRLLRRCDWVVRLPKTRSHWLEVSQCLHNTSGKVWQHVTLNMVWQIMMLVHPVWIKSLGGNGKCLAKRSLFRLPCQFVDQTSQDDGQRRGCSHSGSPSVRRHCPLNSQEGGSIISRVQDLVDGRCLYAKKIMKKVTTRFGVSLLPLLILVTASWSTCSGRIHVSQSRHVTCKRKQVILEHIHPHGSRTYTTSLLLHCTWCKFGHLYQNDKYCWLGHWSESGNWIKYPWTRSTDYFLFDQSYLGFISTQLYLAYNLM